MPIPVREYKDLDLDLTPHPITGDITPLRAEAAVKRAIVNLVLTENYEIFHEPDLGCMVHGSLFKLATLVTNHQLKESIRRVVEGFENRVEIVKLEVFNNLDSNVCRIQLHFSVQNLPDVFDLELLLNRVR